MKRVATILGLFLGAAFAPGLATAQSQVDFVQAFSGEWFVFDRQHSLNRDPCVLELKSLSTSQQYPLSTQNCDGPIATIQRWSIVGGKVVFLSETGALVAELGGNQTRLTGLLVSGDGLVVERAQSKENLAFTRAVRTYRCIFVGYTDTCADANDLAAPKFSKETPTPEVTLLVNLNIRAQPRGDAEIVGVVSKGNKIVVDDCLTASDGQWCRATFGEIIGWMAKTALRQETWPVVTFTN